VIGGLFAAIFGAIFYGNVISNDKQERHDKEDAKKKGTSYIDKWGHRRHGETGKRYTSEDGKVSYYNFCFEQDERERIHKKKAKELANNRDKAERLKINYYNEYIKNKYSLTYKEWILGTHKPSNYYYQKYKKEYSLEDISNYIMYAVRHNLTRF